MSNAIDRRTFVASSAAALVGVAAGARDGRTPGQGRRLERIGLQLYTVRELMQESVPDTLHRVAAVGYDEVEFAGYFGVSAAHLRTMLRDTGLDAPSAHVGLDAVRADPEALIESALTLGHRYLIVAWLAPADRTGPDAWRRVADEFNAFGARCRAANLSFGYHNHDFEFAPTDGQMPYGILLDACDPDLVTMELDLFWIRAGGQDPLEWFSRYPGRFRLCHVKDMDRDGAMVDVGRGVIDFGSVFAASERAGLQHWFVEHDTPADPLASIERSYRALATLTF